MYVCKYVCMVHVDSRAMPDPVHSVLRLRERGVGFDIFFS